MNPIVYGLVTGHDNRELIQLKQADGTPTGSIVGATVTAELEDEDRNRIGGPYTANAGTTGADWTTGLVALVFPAADLAAALVALTLPRVRIHLLVVEGGIGIDYFSGLVPLLKGAL